MISSVADWLLDPSGLTPHGFCLLWEPWLIWTHVLANVGIGLAYFSIPVVLLRFVRKRRDLAFKPVFALFAAFILLCGAGHWADLLTLWWPLYRVEGAIKAATALVSVATAAALWPLLPRALALPSPCPRPRGCARPTRRCATARNGTERASSARPCRCTPSTPRAGSRACPTAGSG